MMVISKTVNKPNHFNPAIRSRLKALLVEKYIHTPQNAELWCLLEDLMYQVSPRSPKPKVMGCLITGEPHSGKTTAVRQFKKAYLENVPEARDNDIFLFQIPSRARLKGVLTKMGCQLKIPDIPPNPKRGYPTFILTEKIAAKLWKNEVKLVIIDEFQKLFELPGESRIEILSGFNDLVNESHIPIILVGVTGVDRILDVGQYDADESNLKGTFCSRFSEFHLAAWKEPNNPQFASLLKIISEDCGFITPKSKPFYSHEGLREWLIEVTGGLTGKIIYLIKWAARYIIRNDLPERITKKILAEVLKTVQANGW